MVGEHFLDIQGAYGDMWATSLRGMNCGHVLDAVIEQHRAVLQEKVLVLSSGEPDYQDDEVHLGAESFVVEP